MRPPRRPWHCGTRSSSRSSWFSGSRACGWCPSYGWGGAGPLGLAILRLAGIYAAVDLLAVIIAPLFFVGWLIQLVCYVCLLAWLFELEVSESIALAVVTFLLKVGAGLILAATLAGAG